MKFIETPLAGAYVIEAAPVGDDRGFFARAFCQKTFQDNGIEFSPLQANHAGSAERATLRGMHYQTGQDAEDKLFRCVKGSIFDVMVDMRADSPTFRQWYGTELSAENKRMMYIPKGFAHGYMTLEDNTEAFYLVSAYYSPNAEAGLRWDDPIVGIRWPINEGLTLSEKDKLWPLLS